MHVGQSAHRLEVVRADIDIAFSLGKVEELLAFADNPKRAPEARLLCGALLKAMYEEAEDARASRPHVDFAWLAATLAGLASRRWQSNVEHTTLLDPRPGVQREEPLGPTDERSRWPRKRR